MTQANTVSTLSVVPVNADAKAKAKAKTLPTTVAQAITSFVKISNKADKDRIKAVDTLYAAGIRPDQLLAPGKDKDRSFYESVVSAVKAGFTATEQALLRKETKSMSEPQKEEKRRLQMSIGSRIRDLRRALETRLARPKGKSEKTEWETVKRKELLKIIEQATKRSASTIDLVKFIADLKSAVARIPA